MFFDRLFCTIYSYMLKQIFRAVCLLLAPYILNAQSLREIKGDTLLVENLEDSRFLSSSKPKTGFLKKSTPYLVPISMLSFGFLANGNHPIQDFNESIREEVLEMPGRRGNFELEDYLQNVPAYSVFALNAIGLKGHNGTVDRIALYGISNTIMSQTVSKLKTWSRKIRPDGSDRRSFPSGHAANAFAAAEFMRLEYKDKSPVYSIVAYGIAATTGAFRIYHNNHWFSDVVAGAGIGILSTNLTYFVYPKIKNVVTKVIKVKASNLRVAPVYQNRTGGIALLLSPK